jgi:hypothetical protein
VTGGFCVYASTGEPIVEILTESFANGCLTRINAKLFDETGELRLEPTAESVAVHGKAALALTSPFDAALLMRKRT